MKTKKLTLTSLLFSVAIVLSILEGQFVIIPACPGIKLGLSNVAVMFTLLSVDKRTAYLISLLKALFSLITRGAVAGVLSLSGGLFSLTVIVLILFFFKNATLSSLSIFGALSHNLMQFTVVRFIYGGVSFLPYLPLLIVSGVLFGVLNAVLLKAVTPSLKKIWRKQ